MGCIRTLFNEKLWYLWHCIFRIYHVVSQFIIYMASETVQCHIRNCVHQKCLSYTRITRFVVYCTSSMQCWDSTQKQLQPINIDSRRLQQEMHKIFIAIKVWYCDKLTQSMVSQHEFNTPSNCKVTLTIQFLLSLTDGSTVPDSIFVETQKNFLLKDASF